MRTHKFIKEQDGRWFIDIPGWPEEAKDALEMILGADTMLDIIAQGENEVTLSISEEEPESFKLQLDWLREESEGGWYQLSSELYNFEVWLCQVTEYVFGHMPKVLYVNY